LFFFVAGRLFGEDSTVLLLICIAGLGIGRVVAMATSSMVVVYFIMAGRVEDRVSLKYLFLFCFVL
jgi:predicted LPLAT superfamily acyltransferase